VKPNLYVVNISIDILILENNIMKTHFKTYYTRFV